MMPFILKSQQHSTEQRRTGLDTGHMAFLGSFSKSGFFKIYWHLYTIKFQHNTLTLGITKSFFSLSFNSYL